MNKNTTEEYIKKINSHLDKYLSPAYPEGIFEAMSYSVNAGGKRLRPLLLLFACEAVGGDIDKAYPFACALEMIHTYSLIHDDLPAMDNDDLRRGKPTCHKQFGEDIAILAGDALLNLAHEIMLDECLAHPEFISAASYISHGSGINGMVGGQFVDVISEGKTPDENTLIYIHRNKTAALIKSALLSGAAIGAADKAQLNILEIAGDKIGIAFQIKDDILDITSDEKTLGKPIHSDEKNNKMTYVSLYGMDKAYSDYERLSAECLETLLKVTDKQSNLYSLCSAIIERVN